MDIFEKYTKAMDTDALAASQREIMDNAKGSGGERREVPHGRYEVEVNKLECKRSQKGNLMISIWFKILEGDFKKSMIFYNGVFYEDWMRHRVVKMLSSLLGDSSHDAEINLLLKSGDVDTINDFCLDMHEEISGKFEYLLDYGQAKGYDTFNIIKRFDLVDDVELPF